MSIGLECTCTKKVTYCDGDCKRVTLDMKPEYPPKQLKTCCNYAVCVCRNRHVQLHKNKSRDHN